MELATCNNVNKTESSNTQDITVPNVYYSHAQTSMLSINN